MSDAIQTELWLEAFVGATKEVAEGFLGLDSELVTQEVGVCQPSSGAYIAVAGKRSTRHLGLVCDEQGRQILAEAMLCVGDDDDPLDKEDVTDAVGEVMNIIAGGIKQRLLDRDPSLKLGIPIFVEGRAHSPIHCQGGQAEVLLGQVAAKLVILGTES